MLGPWLTLKTKNVVFARLDNCASMDIGPHSHHKAISYLFHICHIRHVLNIKNVGTVIVFKNSYPLDMFGFI